MIRILAVAIVAILLAAAVVRNAVVGAWSVSRPDLAATAWASHPDVQRTLMMTAVGGSARAGKEAGADVRDQAARLSGQQPLAVEPFLIAGVEAQVAGKTADAERLFKAAHRRDVRSLPAHFFLADLYLNANRIAEALTEIAHLARLSPGGLSAAPPFLAQYAREPSNWAPMRAVLRDHPELYEGILTSLASDPRNSAAILALADPAHRNARAKWLPTHVAALIGAGEYQRARRLWADVARPAAGSEGLIYDARFADPAAPPPFNWELSSSGLGLAERRPGGSLGVIFYGSQSGALARQLLVLKPGTYRLSMQIAGAVPDPQALSWSVVCDKGKAPVAAFPVPKAGTYRWTFAVPSNCPAVWLQLEGRAQDMNARTEVTVSNLALEPGGKGA